MTDSLNGIYSDISCTSIAVNFILHAINMTGSSRLICCILSVSLNGLDILDQFFTDECVKLHVHLVLKVKVFLQGIEN